MTWIETVAPGEAEGSLKRLYDASEQHFGFVPNIRRSLSLNPAALRADAQLSSAVYSGGALPKEEREMVATVVSALNRCHY